MNFYGDVVRNIQYTILCYVTLDVFTKRMNGYGKPCPTRFRKRIRRSLYLHGQKKMMSSNLMHAS